MAGSKGGPEALRTVFPETEVQTCILQLARHSLRRTSAADRKLLAEALKPIYQAVNMDDAEVRLTEFEESKLGEKYPDVARSWRRQWEEVIPFLAFSPLIRKAIYTTNAIASLSASVRRVVPDRGHFKSEKEATKLIYLVLQEASSKWKAPMRKWSIFKREFAIHFEGRFDPSKYG